MIDRQNLVKVLSEWQLSDPPETKPRDMNIPLDMDLIISIVGPRRPVKIPSVYKKKTSEKSSSNFKGNS